jgi:hypothetical protein
LAIAADGFDRLIERLLPAVKCLAHRSSKSTGRPGHHLKILADGNLMGCRREGQFIYNRSQPETIGEYGRQTKAASKS